MRICELSEISAIYGASDVKPDNVDKYCLRMWPRYEKTTTSPLVWRQCLQLSPQLNTRFTVTDPVELLKFFDVGLLLEDEMDRISAPQALILG